jgi:phosphoribosylformimino-5-aminoimidazole carboxamide ribotide isomerase
MRIIPVIDIMNGLVVRGIAGRRAEYRPLVSRLTTSCQPIDVARALRDTFGFSEFYLADLDAIAGRPPALPIYDELRSLGCRLWVDAGLHHAIDATAIETHVDVLVAGLETLSRPDELAALTSRHGTERIAFSLDLKDGQPLGKLTHWGNREPRALVERAVACDVGRIIVLDLARVGMGTGTGTDDLCAWLLREHPRVETIAGGGVRGTDDLHRLEAQGLHGVLVASALHDGRITQASSCRFSSTATI